MIDDQRFTLVQRGFLPGAFLFVPATVHSVSNHGDRKIQLNSGAGLLVLNLRHATYSPRDATSNTVGELR